MGNKIIKGVNDLSITHPDLYAEIHPTKNGDLNLLTISQGSVKKIWWICSTCGNEWQTSPNQRTASKSGCPECKKRKTSERMAKRNLIIGVTDLASKRPDLLLEWDFENNKSCKPQDFTCGSAQKVWWKCNECGTSFFQKICDRTRMDGKASGCPKCAQEKLQEVRRENGLKSHGIEIYLEQKRQSGDSLFDKRSDLLNEWDYEKNAPLTPKDVTYGSEKDVYWKCDKGHSYKMMIKIKTKGAGCPICSNHRLIKGVNDLETVRPDLAKEWNYEKNYPLTPRDVIAGGKKKYWWKCEKNHEWKTDIYSRIHQNTGCNYCLGRIATPGVNDLATLYPEIAKQWDYRKNKNKKPSDYTAHSKERVYWICEKGHSWNTQITNRVRYNTGCPECIKDRKTSFPEQAVFYYVSQHFLNIKNRDSSLGVEVDVLVNDKNIAIEYDGVYWHKNKLNNDNKKNLKINKKGFTVIRFREKGLNDCNDCINIHVDPNDSNYASLEDGIRLLLSYLEIDDYDVNIAKDYDKILQQLISSEKENSFLVQYPKLALDWDYEKNGNIKPSMIMPKAHKKVYWKCHICSHQWSTLMVSRVSTNSSCPVCSGREAHVGKTDLATCRPYVLEYWDYENNIYEPSTYTSQSQKVVNWKCPICDYAWKTKISDFNACPVCKGIIIKKGVNDLFTKYPRIMKEWVFDKNHDIDPYSEKPSSRKKAWWKCSVCGNEWQTMIYVRTINGSGCKECAKRRISLKNGKKIKNIDTGMIFNSIRDASKYHSCSDTSIANCLKGRSKTASGYHWEYVEE